MPCVVKESIGRETGDGDGDGVVLPFFLPCSSSSEGRAASSASFLPSSQAGRASPAHTKLPSVGRSPCPSFIISLLSHWLPTWATSRLGLALTRVQDQGKSNIKQSYWPLARATHIMHPRDFTLGLKWWPMWPHFIVKFGWSRLRKQMSWCNAPISFEF